MKETIELYRLNFRVCLTGTSLAYQLLESITYYSPRYNKFITCPMWMVSDGATGAMDLTSLGWWVHDRICVIWEWDDGTPITVMQSSMVLSDILVMEKRPVRAKTWGSLTYVWQMIKRPFRKIAA